MARYCSVCESESRAAIDAALARSEPLRRLSARYGLSTSALQRHGKRHLSAALAAMRTGEQEDRRATLLERVEGLIDRAESLYTAAAEEGKAQLALAAVKELRGCLELLGKASGELKDGPQVTINLLSSPEWVNVRGVIFASLAAFPEARAALSGQLLELEAVEE